MKLRLHTLLLTLCALLIAACETGNYGVPGGQSERQAEMLAQSGRHAEAADMYIGLAVNKSGTEQDRLTLLAVEQWLDAGDGQRARNGLRSVTEPTSGELLWLWNTNRAAMYLFLARPDEALAILEPMSQEALTLRHRSRTEALRADAWFQKGDPARAVRLYMQRENWMDSPQEIDRNRERLWAGLLVSDPTDLRLAASSNADPVASGWLSLGALAASTGQQGIGWSNGAARWQETHVGHPGNAILGDLVIPDAGDLRYPRQIALLLPLSGNNGASGKAIQNGFFGAYFAASGGLDDTQRVAVYDVAELGAAAAYSKAVQEGAEFVVGPLLTSNVRELANMGTMSVPILALNNLRDETVIPPGFFQFALAPEDEAISVAQRAIADGAIKAVALYPNNSWGRRVMQSFAGEFQAAGGVLLDYRSYETDSQDFSIEIENLMGLSQSVSRYNRLRANLGEPLQFDPRRRQDVNFVFVAANSRSGRLIKSQLKFHYAGDLPVYSTSLIYSMDGRSNRDLNGIMFADTPWVISPPAWIADYPGMYDDFWPSERRMARLHALGYDSFQLVNHLFSNGSLGGQELTGATGTLFMDEAGRVHRRLAWAEFVGGEPQPLPDPQALDDAGVEPIEDNLTGSPTEWRTQTLSQ